MTRFHIDYLATVLFTVSGVVAQGPTLVKDINTVPLVLSGAPQPARAGVNAEDNSFVQIGSFRYFVATNAATGQELYRTLGVGRATLVKDIRAGPRSSSVRELTVVGRRLFFRANDAVHGRRLWTSDGSAAGTRIVKKLAPGALESIPGSLTEMGGKVYFSATSKSAGFELWVSDGTDAGTRLVKDLLPGVDSSSPYGLRRNSSGTAIYFSAAGSSTGRELWKTDGTSAGTVLVKDIAGGRRSSSPQGLTNLGNTTLFSANTPTTGSELWKTDGTAAGTVLLKDINPGVANGKPDFSYSVMYKGKLWFTANDGATGDELWATDGTTAGTTLVRDIHAGAGNSSPRWFRAVGSTLYFSAESGGIGRELWKTDGTRIGTTLVKDIRPGSSSSSPLHLASAPGSLPSVRSRDNGISGAQAERPLRRSSTLASELAPGVRHTHPSPKAVGSPTTPTTIACSFPRRRGSRELSCGCSRMARLRRVSVQAAAHRARHRGSSPMIRSSAQRRPSIVATCRQTRVPSAC